MTSPKSTTLNFRTNAPWSASFEDSFGTIKNALGKLPVLMNMDVLNACVFDINNKIGWGHFDTFVATLRACFSSFHAFHGCRIVSKKSYLNNGIRLPNQDLYFELARRTWSFKSFPKLTDHELVLTIKSAIEIYPNYVGKICLVLDENHLHQPSSSFSEIGSEFLYVLASMLQKRFPELNFIAPLGKEGSPSIICANIPFDDEPLVFNKVKEEFFRWMIISSLNGFKAQFTNSWTLNYPKRIPAKWMTIKTFDPETPAKQ